VSIPAQNSLRNDSPVATTRSFPDDPNSSTAGVKLPVILIPSIYQPDLFQSLRPVLSHLHLFWELVLTAEPIVVMAPLPDMCANTVHALQR